MSGLTRVAQVLPRLYAIIADAILASRKELLDGLKEQGGGRTICSLLGYDFMVSATGQPFLIEVCASPPLPPCPLVLSIYRTCLPFFCLPVLPVLPVLPIRPLLHTTPSSHSVARVSHAQVNANPLLAGQCPWHETLVQRMVDDFVDLALDAIATPPPAASPPAAPPQLPAVAPPTPVAASQSPPAASAMAPALVPPMAPTCGGEDDSAHESTADGSSSTDKGEGGCSGGGGWKGDGETLPDATTAAATTPFLGPAAPATSPIGAAAMAPVSSPLHTGPKPLHTGRPPLDGIECCETCEDPCGWRLLLGRPGGGLDAPAALFSHSMVNSMAVLMRTEGQRSAARAVSEPITQAAARLSAGPPALTAVKAAREVKAAMRLAQQGAKGKQAGQSSTTRSDKSARSSPPVKCEGAFTLARSPPPVKAVASSVPRQPIPVRAAVDSFSRQPAPLTLTPIHLPYSMLPRPTAAATDHSARMAQQPHTLRSANSPLLAVQLSPPSSDPVPLVAQLRPPMLAVPVKADLSLTC